MGNNDRGNGGSADNPFSGDAEEYLKGKENDQHHRKKHGRSPSSDAVVADTRDHKKKKTSSEEASSAIVLAELSQGHSPAKSLISQYSSGYSPPSDQLSSRKIVRVTHSSGQYSGKPILQGSSGILQKYFRRPDFHQACNSMKIALKSALKEVMNNVNSSSFSVTYGLEAAALINLWKLLDPRLEEIGETAFQGALQLEDGEKMMSDGKSKLKRAFDEIAVEINKKPLLDDPSLD